MYQTNDVDSAWNEIDNHASIISKQIKSKQSPYITSKLKKEMSYCDALKQKFQWTKTEEDHNSYKKQQIKPTF